MIQQTIIEDGAEKFVMIKTTDGQFFLRAFKDAEFHMDAVIRFEKEAQGTGLSVQRIGGAKVSVSEHEVLLHEFSAKYRYFPVAWIPLLIKLMGERYPDHKVRDALLRAE